MRWPIRLQLLVPMVAVVLLAGFLATAITGYWLAIRVRAEQVERLRRVERTLAESAFPLTSQVLKQITGLSGAEFVLISPEKQLLESTLNINELSKITTCKDPVVFLNGRNYLIESVNIRSRSNPQQSAELFILYPEDILTSNIYQAIYPALIAGLIAVVVAITAAMWLARRFVRPIQNLVYRTAVIAQGNFNPMTEPDRNDELCDLVKSINAMAARLADSERQVRQNERLKTLGQLGAAMAHQLRNAATGGTMAIELHRRNCSKADSDESLDVALRQLRLMESYLQKFLSIQRPQSQTRQKVDIVELLNDVIDLLRPSFLHAGIELQFQPPANPLLISGDPESLRQIVTNLIANALDAAVAGNVQPPRVWIDVCRTNNDIGNISVHDTGCGPEEAVRDQLFNSFITTKPNGVGLGLFVARQIAENHRGRLDWQRRNGITSFTFEFPILSDNNYGSHIGSR